ncbi:hypothetical protein NL676_027099 [Syzygium grande]|nr:hypothetical protein NL676_027099 [Syzygium grande]
MITGPTTPQRAQAVKSFSIKSPLGTCSQSGWVAGRVRHTIPQEDFALTQRQTKSCFSGSRDPPRALGCSHEWLPEHRTNKGKSPSPGDVAILKPRCPCAQTGHGMAGLPPFLAL